MKKSFYTTLFLILSSFSSIAHQTLVFLYFLRKNLYITEATHSFMTSEELYRNDSAIISYLPDLNALHLSLIGKIDNQDYKETFNRLLELIVEKNVDTAITDQTHSQGGSMDSRAWLVVKWLPELKKAVGERYFTIVGVSEAKLGIKKFISQYLEQTFKKMTPFPVEMFEDLNAALDWLKQKKGL